MMWAKFRGSLMGTFWLQVNTGQFDEGRMFAQGIELGSQHGTTPLELIDTRLSKHPTERTITVEEYKDLLSSILPG